MELVAKNKRKVELDSNEAISCSIICEKRKKDETSLLM